MRILNAAQMREADRRTIEDLGIPSIVLMENAGRQVVAAIETTFDDLPNRRVAVLCGRGNNGGDGFVVARTLKQRGVDVSVFLLARVAEVDGDAQLNLNILGRLGLTLVEVPTEQAWKLHFSELFGFDVIVDAIFGTGLTKPLVGVLQTVVADLNGSGIPIVSVDLPSGLSADSHEIIGETIQASLTVTLAAPKLPLVLSPGEFRVGDLVIADIGIPATIIEGLDAPRTHLLLREQMRALIQPRLADSHKGNYGRVLLVAGSVGKTGAAQLAAAGALRAGAGLVTVATPRGCVPIVAGHAPEYMTEGLEDVPTGTVDLSALDRVLELPCDVIAVGPGLGTGPAPAAFVQALLERAGAPLVLDADALNAFAEVPDRLQGGKDFSIIITPHPGEMARLAGTSVDEVQANRVEVARTFAARHRVHVILKGSRTVIATPDGNVFINLTGNPGMATGGTGDVLTGMVAACLAQLLDADTACKVGVYVHGLAGDLAAAERGEVALIATDLVEHIGQAVLELTEPKRVRRDE